MIVDFIHLGRFNADGTIIGGKGLVQPGHHTADTGGIINEIDAGSIFGSVHGAINTGNAATDHQNRIAHHFPQVVVVVLNQLYSVFLIPKWNLRLEYWNNGKMECWEEHLESKKNSISIPNPIIPQFQYSIIPN
jgi:hypothetical protein